MHVLIGLFAVFALAYALFHGHHYRRNRRHMGVWYSLKGPWGTRIRVTKRL